MMKKVCACVSPNLGLGFTYEGLRRPFITLLVTAGLGWALGAGFKDVLKAFFVIGIIYTLIRFKTPTQAQTHENPHFLSWPKKENIEQAVHNFDFFIHRLVVRATEKEFEKQSKSSGQCLEPYIHIPPEFMKYSDKNIPSMNKYIESMAKIQCRRAASLAKDQERTELIAQGDSFSKLFGSMKSEATKKNIDATKESFIALMKKVDGILDRFPDSYRYPTDSKDAWETKEKALLSLKALLIQTDRERLSPRTRSMPSIKVLKATEIKTIFPEPLVTLISDIYTAWGCSSFVDERTTKQVESSSSTPNMPGSVRCFHLDEVGALPTLAEVKTPSHGQALEKHLTEYAKVSHKMAQKSSSNDPVPVGYAEYTGVGIYKDHHNCKVVFDYKTGKMFITLTHYTRFDFEEDTRVSVNKDSGKFSAFFAVDMQS